MMGTILIYIFRTYHNDNDDNYDDDDDDDEDDNDDNDDEYDDDDDDDDYGDDTGGWIPRCLLWSRVSGNSILFISGS